MLKGDWKLWTLLFSVSLCHGSGPLDFRKLSRSGEGRGSLDLTEKGASKGPVSISSLCCEELAFTPGV